MTSGEEVAARTRARVRMWTGLLLLAALMSAELTREVLTRSGLTRFDPTVTQWIVEHRTGWLTFLAGGLTWLGSSFVIIPLGLLIGGLFFFRRAQWMPVAGLAVSFLGAAAIYDVMKPVVGRARPVAQLQVGGPDDGFAFPSGHSTQSMAFYGMLAVILWFTSSPGRRLIYAIGAALIVAIVGASRLYLGVHWLTDVLGGFAIGLTWLALTVIAFSSPSAQRLLDRRGTGSVFS